MTIYITPYDRVNNNYLNVGSSIELFEIYYKTDEGPLGFNIDEKGNILFRKIVEGTIWLNEYNNNFEFMDAALFADRRMLSFDGVFMFPVEDILKEVKKEKEFQMAIIKNQPLRKYNKPLIPEIPSFFTQFYDKASKKYASNKIEMLFEKGVDLAVGDNDSLGSHFIMKQESLFMKRLVACCKDIDIPIKYVASDRYVPAW